MRITFHLKKTMGPGWGRQKSPTFGGIWAPNQLSGADLCPVLTSEAGQKKWWCCGAYAPPAPPRLVPLTVL